MEKRRKHKIKISDERKQAAGLVLFFIRFYKPAAAVASVVIFFFVYNMYIVDRSMADIQFALERAGKAQNIDDVQGLNLVLSAVVLKEVANKKIDSQSLINLDLASNITKNPEMLNQVKDAKFMLSEVLAKKKKERNQVLVALDNLNDKVMKGGSGVRNFLSKATMKELVVVEIRDGKLISAAKKYEENMDFNNAIKAYESALKQVPQYEGIEKVHIGYLYQRIENFNRARVLYEDVLKNASGTQSAEIAKKLMDNLRNLEDISKRRQKVEEDILREASTDKLQQLYYDLGALKGLLEDFTGAENVYQKVVDLGPKTELGQKAKFNLAFNYKLQAKYADSEKIFSQFNKEFPRNDLAPDAKYWKADSLRNQGRFEEAAEGFKEVAADFKDKPIAPAALFRAGYTYMYDIKDAEKSRAVFDDLKKYFGDSEISKHVEKVVISDIGGVYRDEGFKLMLQGKLEEAVGKFDQAIKVNPSDGIAYSGFSAAKGLMQQLQEALDNAKKGVELAPNNSYTNANLGFVYILRNNYKDASESYQKALGIDPKYAEARYNLGLIYQDQGQFDKAIDVYKEAIKYKPELAEAYNNLGSCYWALGRLDDASEEFARALKFDPGLAEAHYNMALIHFIFGRLKQAEAEMLKALDLTDSIKDASYVLGLIRQKMQENIK